MLPEAIMNPASSPEAPGAKAARVCGVLAIVCSATCIGIPAGIALGVVALVKNAKARRHEREEPASYRRSSAAGLALGLVGLLLPVVMLPFAGIVSAIAIPALLGQRERARELACTAALRSQVDTLQVAYLRLADRDRAALIQALERQLATAPGRNVYDPARPACSPVIAVVNASAEDEMQVLLEPLAAVKGQLVFAVGFPPGKDHPGYLAGAVRTGSLNRPVLCRVVELP